MQRVKKNSTIAICAKIAKNGKIAKNAERKRAKQNL